jgi:chloride channel protein, CIC family
VSSGVTPTARDPPATSDDTEARGLAWLALIAGVSGIATGILGAAFRVCLNHADALRSGINTWAHQWPLVGWVLPVAIAALLVGLASWLVQHFAPLAAGSGVQHV